MPHASPLMPSHPQASTRAWVTLLTRSSYLPGVITLASSLSTHATAYPLVVLTTPSLPQSCLQALKIESTYNPLLKIHPTQPLKLPEGREMTLIAARFEDTWTKLRAFELITYEACVFLDADITIFKNMDEIFDLDLPGDNWIAANQSCVCNLDHDDWAPKEWNRENCPYTPLKHPAALKEASPIPPGAAPPDTYALLNGGVFLYHPSEELWRSMYHHFLTSPELSTFQFPDQDFLASMFCGRWQPLPWKYNALKTMKQWHTNIWRDEEVRGLHYIVDKPWDKRVANDGIGGHMGRDGETHAWWWNVWREWRSRRSGELVAIIDDLVAKPLSALADEEQCKNNRNKGFPIPIPPAG